MARVSGPCGIPAQPVRSPSQPEPPGPASGLRPNHSTLTGRSLIGRKGLRALWPRRDEPRRRSVESKLCPESLRPPNGIRETTLAHYSISGFTGARGQDPLGLLDFEGKDRAGSPSCVDVLPAVLRTGTSERTGSAEPGFEIQRTR